MNTPTPIQDIETADQAHQALTRRIAELTREVEELKWSTAAGNNGAVARLASEIAHEVKNPLAALMMGVEYLDRHAPRKGEIKRVLRDMQQAIEQANSVVVRLLDGAATPRHRAPRRTARGRRQPGVVAGRA